MIAVAHDKGGVPPAFDGGGAMVHDRVRQEMREVLREAQPVPFLDQTAAGLLQEARNYYQRAGLDSAQLVPYGKDILLLTWKGDWINDGLCMLLAYQGLTTTNEGLAINAANTSTDRFLDALAGIAEMNDLEPETILANTKNILREKWDWVLPESLLRKSFASLALDLAGARDLAHQISASGEAATNSTVFENHEG